MEFGLFTEFHPPPAPARRRRLYWPALLVVDLQRELWDSALALGVQSRVGGHVGAPTALIPEAGGEVALAEVVEDRDESAPSDALRDTLDTGHVGPGRLTDEEARRRQPHAHPVRLVDSDRDALVDHFLVQDRRHDVFGASQWLKPLD